MKKLTATIAAASVLALLPHLAAAEEAGPQGTVIVDETEEVQYGDADTASEPSDAPRRPAGGFTITIGGSGGANSESITSQAISAQARAAALSAEEDRRREMGGDGDQ